MHPLEMPTWEGISDLVRAGFDDRQIRRILFFRQYHRAHEQQSKHHTGGDGATCNGAEALAEEEANDG